MANKYAVATGNWSSAAVWSATDGGAGGDGAPANGDIVYMTALSGNITVTRDAANQGANSLICTGFTGTLNQNNGTMQWGKDNNAGQFTLSSTMTYSNGGNIQFLNSSGTFNITTAGLTLTNVFFIFAGLSNASTGSMKFLDTVVSCGGINNSAGGGTLDTNGQTITCAGAFGTTTGGLTRRYLTMGASIITCGSWSFSGTDVMTITANTASITCTSTQGFIDTFTDTGTYYNVTVAGTGQSILFDCKPTITNSLTFSGAGLVTQNTLNVTTTGSLSFSGTSATSRLTIHGKNLIITAASAGTMQNTNFNNVNIAGAAASISGSSFSNMGGNTGIIFDVVGQNLYWVGGSGNRSDAANHISSSSGGAPGTGRNPLSEDTLIFDSNSFTAISKTITYDPATAIMTGFDDYTLATNSPIIACGGIGTKQWFLRGLILITGMTFSGSGVPVWRYGDLLKITSGGVALGRAMTLNMFNGIFQIQDAFQANAITITTGTLDANNFNITMTSISAASSGVLGLIMGSGTWTCTGTGTIWNMGSPSVVIITPGTSTISYTDVSATAKAFTGGSKTYNVLAITGGGTGTVTINGSNTFAKLPQITGGTKSIIFTISTTQTFLDGSTGFGNGTNVITITSSSAGTQATVSMASGKANCNYLSLKDSAATGGAIWYAGANSTNVSNNTGWIFSSGNVSAIQGISSITGIQSITF